MNEQFFVTIAALIVSVVLALNTVIDSWHRRKIEQIEKSQELMEELGQLIPLEGWSVSTYTATSIGGKQVRVSKQLNKDHTVMYMITVPLPRKESALKLLP